MALVNRISGVGVDDIANAKSSTSSGSPLPLLLVHLLLLVGRVAKVTTISSSTGRKIRRRSANITPARMYTSSR
jgi:hypothetical protein